jgi:hypothetical protein
MRRSTLSSLHPSHCSDQEVQCLLLLCFCESIIDKGPRPECVFTQSAAISGVARWAVLLFAAISASARRALHVLWPAPVRRERIRRPLLWMQPALLRRAPARSNAANHKISLPFADFQFLISHNSSESKKRDFNKIIFRGCHSNRELARTKEK